MARRSYLKVVGVVENMSEFVAPDGQRFALFGRGGGAALAAEIGAPLVASIPIEPEVSEGGDTGQPVVLSAPDHPRGRRSTRSPARSWTSCSRRSRWPAAPRASSNSRPPTSPPSTPPRHSDGKDGLKVRFETSDNCAMSCSSIADRVFSAARPHDLVSAMGAEFESDLVSELRAAVAGPHVSETDMLGIADAVLLILHEWTVSVETVCQLDHAPGETI